jgi:excinuclease ABC subunit B
MGSPERYAERLVMLEAGAQMSREDIFRRLVEVQYQRNDMVLERGRFRARGDVFEIQPVNAETAYRVSMFGDEIESITHFHPVTGEVFGDLQYAAIYPATHYVTPMDTLERAVSEIKAEMEERCALFDAQGKLVESHRLRQRTEYDMEMLREVGFCSGIENYSRILDGRSPGEPPATLLDFFPPDFLCFIDESHNTVPQVRGMYEGDRSRKMALIEHGFRLPSAADNRPIRLEEFLERVGQVVFVSATPGQFERSNSSSIVEQIIRPTGLVDPEVDVRPTQNQVDDLISEVRARVEVDERVLVTTLTKRMAEDLTDYLVDAGIKARYLHSDIDAIERIRVVRELRLGEFDVLVGVNLLREGLDLPEVTLVAILDADKEGFLRGQTALIQTIGRAARNVNGRVLMYADRETEAMRVAMEETSRRREIQRRHNEEHGITPASINKGVSDIVEFLGLSGGGGSRRRGKREQAVPEGATPDEIRRVMVEVEQEMMTAAEELRFERAAELRDRLAVLRAELGEDALVAGAEG